MKRLAWIGKPAPASVLSSASSVALIVKSSLEDIAGLYTYTGSWYTGVGVIGDTVGAGEGATPGIVHGGRFGAAGGDGGGVKLPGDGVPVVGVGAAPAVGMEDGPVGGVGVPLGGWLGPGVGAPDGGGSVEESVPPEP